MEPSPAQVIAAWNTQQEKAGLQHMDNVSLPEEAG
jgi:hypothetical protein